MKNPPRTGWCHLRAQLHSTFRQDGYKRKRAARQRRIRHRALVARQWSVRMPLSGGLELIDLKDPTPRIPG